MATWIQEEYDKTAQIERMEWENIKEEELKAAINATSNWKAPGMDGITNFWLKRLHAIHKPLTTAYNDIISGTQTPLWMTKGKTHLIAKNKHTNLAKNYRPITCLNNIYKVLTKIISERLYTHINKNNLFPSEQKVVLKTLMVVKTIY